MQRISALQFHIQWRARGPDIFKADVLNAPKIFIPRPDRFTYPQRNELMGFFNTDIFETDIADQSRIALINAHRPFPALIVDDITIGKKHILHRLSDLGTDAQGMSHRAPQHVGSGNDIFGWALPLVGFNNNQVIISTDKTIFHQHIPTIADIYPVGVCTVAQYLYIIHYHTVRLPDGHVPG